MLLMTEAKAEHYVRNAGRYFILGIAFLVVVGTQDHDEKFGGIIGCMFILLAVHAFGLRKWRTEPGLWMLSAFVSVVGLLCYIGFTYEGWWKLIVAAPAKAGRLPKQNLRWTIESSIALYVYFIHVRLSMTLTRLNWLATHPKVHE